MNSPYTDHTTQQQKFIRTFSADVNSTELVWHRDRSDREVKVISGQGWKFQHDNQIPQQLSAGDVINVKKNQFHRLLKGQDELILEITEF
jgi:quercetin dioxygenase-like cupin family protein